MEKFKTVFYIFIIIFTTFIFLSYIYMISYTPNYKVYIPQHIEGDIIAGDNNGNKNIDIYLSKQCIHCQLWEKEYKNDFESFAKKNNLKITYRYINIEEPLFQTDKNTQFFLSKGISNTPSYVYQNCYYRGAPNTKKILLLLHKKIENICQKNDN